MLSGWKITARTQLSEILKIAALQKRVCAHRVLRMKVVCPNLAYRVASPSLPLLQRAAVGLKRVRWQGGKDVPAQATFHQGFSDGEMWLPAPSPSQGDALQAQSVKAVMSTCWAKPLWSCR